MGQSQGARTKLRIIARRGAASESVTVLAASRGRARGRRYNG